MDLGRRLMEELAEVTAEEAEGMTKRGNAS
jgi:hypothetical protein